MRSWIANGRKLLGDRALVISAAFTPILFLVVSITTSPWANDDTINKNFRAETVESGKTLFEQIGFFTDYWATSAGRFFPGSVTWTFGLFWFVNDRVAYKLIIAMVLICALLMFTLAAWIYTRSKNVAFLLLFITLATLQIRVFLDGITSFTALLPLTILFTCTALVLSSKQKGWISSCIAAFIFQLALFTYETVILFVPVLMFLLWLKTRKILRTLVFAVPAAITALIALTLRSQLNPLSTPLAYSVSLDPIQVSSTFAKQFSASLPLSQWWLGAPGLPNMSKIFIILAIIFVGIPVFIGLTIIAEKKMELVPTNKLLLMAGVGIWVVFSSAALISITARWQQDLSWGEGYLNVIYQYLGFALVFTAIVLGVFQFSQRLGNQQFGLGIRIFTCALIAFTTSLTMASNLVITSLQ